MAGPKKSPAELAAELQRLRESHVADRDRLSLVHEIAVYQEELLVQNEALMRAQSALEEVRDQFVELFDFAPNGYVTLDEHGVICQCNLTAAALLGRPRPAIEGLPLVGFVTVDSRPVLFDFLRRCRTGDQAEVEIEVTLKTRDGIRDVQLFCRPQSSRDGASRFFTSLIDISDKKALDRARARTADERSALANRLLVAIDDERQRIAQDLHDDIGQQLTAIRLKLESIAGPAPSAADLRSVQYMIERLDQRLHLIATELRPAALDLGLVTAATQFVREWSQSHGIPAEFRAHGVADGQLRPDAETHLYRIMKEALNNVAKHAAARHVSVLLEYRRDEVVLLIEDDGQGFTADRKGAQRASLGLVGMRERAAMIGGRMHLETAPGEGTSLFVYVPVPERSSER